MLSLDNVQSDAQDDTKQLNDGFSAMNNGKRFKAQIVLIENVPGLFIDPCGIPTGTEWKQQRWSERELVLIQNNVSD